ncbi:hypothetical protein GCM10010988_21150 [Cnuibacter physcomitrellae]|nr:hypothetical protein GCM10010988_21150 [Cnuibacter physcomitrellae]
MLDHVHGDGQALLSGEERSDRDGRHCDPCHVDSVHILAGPARGPVGGRDRYRGAMERRTGIPTVRT